MKKTYKFCLDILEYPVERHVRALANVVMALSSYVCWSVTSLSKSPLFHYQYSSIADAVKHFAYNEVQRGIVERWIIRHLMKHFWDHSARLVLQTDKTPMAKPHSPTLAQRTLVAVPNRVVKGNKPVDIGYEYSYVNLFWGGEGKGWSLPLMINQIGIKETAQLVAVTQVCSLLKDKELLFAGQGLVVNTLDRAYGAKYLEGVKGVENLVSLVALRYGSKIYGAPDEPAGKKVFGRCYYLIEQNRHKTFLKHPRSGQPYSVCQQALSGRTPDEACQYADVLDNGRQVIVSLQRFNDMLWRTKQHISMKDKPADVLCAKIADAKTLKPVFDRPLFVAAVGPKRSQVSARQIFEDYRKRAAIEPHFRFSKQKLFMRAFQTPVAQHLHNWLNIVMISVWLLFSARYETPDRPEKWQQYAERKAARAKPRQQGALSIAQIRKGLQELLLTFDQTPFLPPKSKPGPGRKQGQTRQKRPTFPYVKKNTLKSRDSSPP